MDIFIYNIPISIAGQDEKTATLNQVIDSKHYVSTVDSTLLKYRRLHLATDQCQWRQSCQAFFLPWWWEEQMVSMTAFS